MICVKCKSAIPDDSRYCSMCGKKQVHEMKTRKNRPHGAGTVYKVSGARRKPWAAARYKKLIGYFYTREDALKALEAVKCRNPELDCEQNGNINIQRKKISIVKGDLRVGLSYHITSTTLCRRAFFAGGSASLYSLSSERTPIAC